MLNNLMPEAGEHWTVLVLLATLPLAAASAAVLAAARLSTRPDVPIHNTPGVRTYATLRSRAAWLAAHRAIEKRLLATGYALAAASLFNALLVAWTDVRYALLIELGVGIVLLPAVLLRLAWIAHKTAAAVTD